VLNLNKYKKPIQNIINFVLHHNRYTMSNISKSEYGFYSKVVELLRSAQQTVVQTVNKTMVFTYFEIGKMIVEEEQGGENRAKYGQFLLSELSIKLTEEFGKGFSVTNIKQMRSFYLIYSKGQKVSDEFNLSWSHYLMLMRISDEKERRFYEIESHKSSWSLREHLRQRRGFIRCPRVRKKNEKVTSTEAFIKTPNHSGWAFFIFEKNCV